MIIAMSLHEKGKAALKKGNLQLAIVLLLEAKDEYNQCRSEILTAVDNYVRAHHMFSRILNFLIANKKLYFPLKK